MSDGLHLIGSDDKENKQKQLTGTRSGYFLLILSPSARRFSNGHSSLYWNFIFLEKFPFFYLKNHWYSNFFLLNQNYRYSMLCSNVLSFFFCLDCGCSSAVVFTIINFVLQINCVEEKPVEGNWQSCYCAYNKLSLCLIECV